MDIIIKVVGQTATGKSALAQLIFETLKERGIVSGEFEDVDIKYGPDGKPREKAIVDAVLQSIIDRNINVKVVSEGRRR